VIDIREQFPMNIEKTRQIASELGIRHSYEQNKNGPYLMTTSFSLLFKKTD